MPENQDSSPPHPKSLAQPKRSRAPPKSPAQTDSQPNSPAYPKSPGQPKRIIICCDGTWMSSVSENFTIPSNVTRMARYIARVGHDKEKGDMQQLVYYSAGIGSGSGWWPVKEIQGGAGTGFVERVIEAYNFIVLNYNPGDKIICIGFSRGAYTARAVAGLITDIGIILPRDLQDFPYLYQFYRNYPDSHRFRKSQVWRQWIQGKPILEFITGSCGSLEDRSQWKKRGSHPGCTRWVEAVAVFDTVGSLGIPDATGLASLITGAAKLIVGLCKILNLSFLVPVEDLGLHNVELSPYIKNAYHAMALHEHRKPFSPTLWHLPPEYPDNHSDKNDGMTPKYGDVSALEREWRQLQKDKSIPPEKLDEIWGKLVEAKMSKELENIEPELKQMWFPGFHINIGGGNYDLLDERRGDFEQISNITLLWMAEQLKCHVTFEKGLAENSRKDRLKLTAPVVKELFMARESDHWLFRQIIYLIKRSGKDYHNIWKTWRRFSEYSKCVLGDWTTGPIIDSYRGLMKLSGSVIRTPGAYKRCRFRHKTFEELGQTKEQIHPSVTYRMEMLLDPPKSYVLRGFKRNEIRGKEIRFEWVKGDIKIPEHKIPTEKENYERAYMGGHAREWLEKQYRM